MSELPPGWLSCRLGDAVAYGATEKVEPDEISQDSWILELEDIEKDTSRILQHLTLGERASKSTKNRFWKGDVLYGKLRPYLNKVVIANEDGYCTTEILPLRPTEAVVGRFLFHWLKHPEFAAYVQATSHGLNMPRLGTETGKAAPFVLAPLNEQKRIADKLDALLGQVDACRERLDRVPGILKRFRQSVLAAATSGQLTEDWREGKRLAEWDQTDLAGCGLVSGGLTKNAGRLALPLKRLYLRVANVLANRLDLSDVSEIGLTQSEFERTKLEPGDLLVVEGNGSLEQVGRVAIWSGEISDCSHQNHLIRWRTRGPEPRFVLYWLLSPIGRKSLMDIASSTTGLHTLSLSKVSSVPILLPPIEEQQEIVRRVDKFFAYADELEARVAAARAQVERLTPALLAKAFRGELVPQDPNDESAEVLLERLRAENAGQAKPRRGRKAKADPVHESAP